MEAQGSLPITASPHSIGRMTPLGRLTAAAAVAAGLSVAIYLKRIYLKRRRATRCIDTGGTPKGDTTSSPANATIRPRSRWCLDDLPTFRYSTDYLLVYKHHGKLLPQNRARALAYNSIMCGLRCTTKSPPLHANVSPVRRLAYGPPNRGNNARNTT